MFPSWFTFLGFSFVFLDMGPSILFFVFPFFLSFGLFMIRGVSSSFKSERRARNFSFTIKWQPLDGKYFGSGAKKNS